MLDAGALMAVDRNDRDLVADLKTARVAGWELRTNGAVVAQVWRDSDGRQANLARLMKAIDVRPVDAKVGRDAGVLLGKVTTGDAIDATVVTIAAAGDRIITSDPGDIGGLVAVAGRGVIVVPC